MKPSASLHVVQPGQAATVADRIRQLAVDQAALARDDVQTWIDGLSAGARHAERIASGGDAYPIGVREVARIEADHLARQALTLSAIMERTAS